MKSTKKIALFPGTFDPFTRGHASLVERGLRLADEVIVAIGENEAKSGLFSVEERIEMICSLYACDTRIRVASYKGLTVDFAKEVGASYLLRGVRSSIDFEYEKNIADFNRKVADIETILLVSDPDLAHISASAVRELLRFGKSVSNYLPEGLFLPQKRINS